MKWKPVATVLGLLVTSLTAMAESILLPERLFFSQTLNAERRVRVALPASYSQGGGLRYPVLYLHDGQNVFSSAGPDASFGWGSWQADRTAAASAAAGRAREVILVAIDNTPQRYLEYRGPSLSGATSADQPHLRYARFLIQDLKPAIDREFRTLPDPQHTAVLGSSMGGLCSLVLAWNHPEVFGSAASLSGAFQVERTQFLSRVLGPYRGSRKPVRLYLDSGVVDYTGGDDGAALTRRVVERLRAIGWRTEQDLKHVVDAQPRSPEQSAAAGLPDSKWKEAQTSQHNEFYWRLRFGQALEFIFPP